MPASLENLAEGVLAFQQRHLVTPLDASPDATGFAELALSAFALQYRCIESYRSFCDRRGVRPETISNWRQIPPVPTAAFKELDLACAPPERIFITSGTTEGRNRPGRHLVPRLDLYRAGALAHFKRMVLPDGLQPRLIALLADPTILQDSSLVQMVDWIRTDLCADNGIWLVKHDGFDPERAQMEIETEARLGQPLLLFGVRASFTALLDHLAATRATILLPADSRVVDTGGPKGGRTLSDAGFLSACWHRLGIAGYQCLNEYGMTELGSQYYDDVLRERLDGSNSPRRKAPPAWLATLALDPNTLEPVPDGTPGLLAHFDLANIGSVLAVLTDDIGVLHGRRLTLRGRREGAEPRGCALALADLLATKAPVDRVGEHASLPVLALADVLGTKVPEHAP